MINFENMADADAATRQMLIDNWANIPEDIRSQLFSFGQLGTSPVDMFVNSAELIYARRDDLPAAMKPVAAGLFRFCAMHGFHGLQNDNRGALAASVLDGDTVDNPPEPLPQYVPQPVEAPAP